MSLQINDLSFAYGSTLILQKLNFAIAENKVTSVIGPNGIGKSTLVRCLANIYQPDQGVVYLDGKNIATITGRELAKQLGYVPQSHSDVFSITVYEAILLGRKPYIRWSVKGQDLKIVDGLIQRLGLEQFAQRTLNTLSGGERQKVAIARALAQEPTVLFLDEPTSSLDMAHQLELMELVVDLARRQGTTIVLVLHDLNLAARFSDQIILLGRQGIYAQGVPQSVITPEHIRAIYGVEVEVLATSKGPQVLPLHIVKEESRCKR